MADRDENGRFIAGNKAAKGNPYARKAAAMRRALYNSVSAEDIRRIVATLKRQAAAGNLKAITILLDRLLGSAGPGVDLMERLEKLDNLLNEQREEAGDDE